MQFQKWFSLGYGYNEWIRDRHAFFSIMWGWLAVDIIPMTQGSLDWLTFLTHAKIAAAMGVASVLKNFVTNNQPS